MGVNIGVYAYMCRHREWDSRVLKHSFEQVAAARWPGAGENKEENSAAILHKQTDNAMMGAIEGPYIFH